jgi:flavin prenyltransferase
VRSSRHRYQPFTDDLIDHSVGRVLDLFGLEMPKLRRWTGMRANGEHASAVEPLPATNGS